LVADPMGFFLQDGWLWSHRYLNTTTRSSQKKIPLPGVIYAL
jgi:hypothetical protein